MSKDFKARLSSKSRVLFIMVSVLCLLFGSVMCGCNTFTSNPLPSWSNSSPTRQAIIDFVSDVTNSNSSNFVPEEDRVATFDADGTYYCERADYLQSYIARYVAPLRLQNDPTFQPDAKLKAAIDSGFTTQDQQVEILAGMTNEEVEQYVEQFKQTPQPCFNNLTFGEAFYKPMLELMQYLQDNGFKVYVISGTDETIVRAMAQGVLDIPQTQIVGSLCELEASNQGSTPDEKYTLQPSDEMLRTTKYDIVDNLTKVISIADYIGDRPIFTAGNSSGDFSMLQYASSNEKYKTFEMLICHDDALREFVYPTGTKIQELENTAKEHGYKYVSMKNEFDVIFKGGYGVTVKPPSEYVTYN